MIIPINNGRTITPIYIPQPVTVTNPGSLEQSNAEVQSNNEPTLATWILLGLIITVIIACTIWFIRLLLKYFLGGKE